MFRQLPNERQQTISYPVLIFAIARKSFCKKAFHVKKSPYDHCHHQSDSEQSPPRSKRERHPNQHDESADVHRMAYERVWSGSNDLLLAADLDNSGCKCIFPENEKYQEESECDQNVAESDYVRRHRRPSKTMIESGDNED